MSLYPHLDAGILIFAACLRPAFCRLSRPVEVKNRHTKMTVNDRRAIILVFLIKK